MQGSGALVKLSPKKTAPEGAVEVLKHLADQWRRVWPRLSDCRLMQALSFWA